MAAQITCLEITDRSEELTIEQVKGAIAFVRSPERFIVDIERITSIKIRVRIHAFSEETSNRIASWISHRFGRKGSVSLVENPHKALSTYVVPPSRQPSSDTAIAKLGDSKIKDGKKPSKA